MCLGWGACQMPLPPSGASGSPRFETERIRSHADTPAAGKGILRAEEAVPNIDSNSPQMDRLRTRVKAASEEFEVAISFHEAWKPCAFDEALHRRLGMSYATNTFVAIKLALRHEMLMAMMRLWDNDRRTIRLPSIANTLRDKRAIEVLASEDAMNRSAGRIGNSGERLAQRAAKAIRASIEKGQAGLHRRAREAIDIIDSYAEGRTNHHIMTILRTIRDQHLAHRQLDRANKAPDGSHAAAQHMYEDLTRLFELLWNVVLHTHYSLMEAAEIKEGYAGHFWAGVAR